ncbi:MAG: galactokinase, partial [Atopobiaceae bacterium]|nr:galactokinase [Atopobiaceae bacterium]
TPNTPMRVLDFVDPGLAVGLVRAGPPHAASTDDYAAVPGEMQAIAAKLGHARLCEVDKADFDRQVPALREQFGDRAVLRCIHYWYENDLVDRRWDALQSADVDTFLQLTRASGASSAMYLQNVAAELGREQPAMYALGLAEHVLDGRGAVRIHGGGFGGTIQAFVPLDLADEFVERMDFWLGAGSARRYAVSDKGAYAAWL